MKIWLRVKVGFMFLMALPFLGVAFLISVTAWCVDKYRNHDPKVNVKTKCPCCGDRGVKRLNFVLTTDAAKGALELTCLLCGAPFFLNCLVSPIKWMAPNTNTQAQIAKDRVKRMVI